uniref:uncharacterized protein LOC120345142 n=1 Tax=Styela clava TaxID=7725 RepID=UPI00193A1589|nr:uncharacterized protein LOC120345142 [Styela clava]
MNYGKPANIYDLAHYQLLRTYFRSLIPAVWARIDIWTGMEYKNNQLLLSSGDPITMATEVWYPGYPRFDASFTNVAVGVNEAPEYEDQGMYNHLPSWSLHGVICEI